MAEQESRTISTNVKWAWQRKFQNGEIILNTGLMLGYEKAGKDEDGMPVYKIKEAEAAIVRRIYREFLSGYSITQICRRLEADGIPTPLKKAQWRASTVHSILTNEKYTGNCILGKTYKPDVLTKRRLQNDGQKAPLYYAENSHPAIIDQQMFDLVKHEMRNRQEAPDKATGNTRYTSKYPFSGLLECADCGNHLRRQVRTMGSGKRVASWGCSNRILHGRTSCDSHHVREDVLQRTYAAIIKELTAHAEEVIATLKEGVQVAMHPQNAERLRQADQAVLDLQKKVMALRKQRQENQITADTYSQEIEKCSKEMQDLETQKSELQTAEARYAEVTIWLDAFEDAINNTKGEVANEIALMKILVDRITVYDDGMEVHFKCGTSVKHEYVK